MGYMGTRLLADRENPGHYVIIADFGVVDPDVSAADEAARNNERPETQELGAPRSRSIDGEPEYRHYDWRVPHRRLKDSPSDGRASS